MCALVPVSPSNPSSHPNACRLRLRCTGACAPRPYRRLALQAVERAKYSAELEAELAQLRAECTQLRALLDDSERRLRSCAALSVRHQSTLLLPPSLVLPMCPCRAASSLPPAQPHPSGCSKRWIDSASGVRSEERAASAVARRRAEAQLAQQQCEFDAMVRAVSDDGSSRLQARERDHDTQRTARRGAARLSTRPSR